MEELWSRGRLLRLGSVEIGVVSMVGAGLGMMGRTRVVEEVGERGCPRLRRMELDSTRTGRLRGR